MKRDRLDDAIDAVAARLTRVADDEGLALRIVNALPQRSIWLPLGWKSRFALAAIALAATVGVVQRSFDDRSTDVLRTKNTSVSFVEYHAPATRTTVEPALIVRRTIVEPPQNDRRTIDVPDHERSLPAIQAMTALGMSSLTPRDLPASEPLSLTPIDIADLPMTAETFPPRDF